MTRKTRLLAAAFSAVVTVSNLVDAVAAFAAPAANVITTPVAAAQVRYGTIKVDGLNIAYREAGDPKLPKLVLLHGWPSSSHQYRNLILALGQRFHVIAPDYQGFGNSDHPDPATYHYSFDAIARRWKSSSPPRASTTTACSCRITAARSASASSGTIPRRWTG